MLEPIIAQVTSVDPRDIVRQDALIGSYFQSSLKSTDTDVTYVSKYKIPSTQSDTVDDVFLAPLPVVSSRAKHASKLPVRPTVPRILNLFQRPNPRATDQFVINPFVPSHKPVMKNPHCFHRSSKTQKRSTGVKAKNRTSVTKAGSLSQAKSDSLSIAKHTTLVQSNTTKTKSIITIKRTEAAVKSSRSGSLKPTAIAHTVTSTVDVTKSPLSFTSERNTGSTLSHTGGSHARESLCGSTTRAQSLAIGTFSANIPPRCQVTSTVTSQTLTKSRVNASPTQSTYSVPLYPSPMIIAPSSPTNVPTETEHHKTSSAVDNDGSSMPPTVKSMRAPHRIIIPVTIGSFSTSDRLGFGTMSSTSQTTPKTRVGVMMRTIQTTATVTNVTTSSDPSRSVSTGLRKSFTVLTTRGNRSFPPGATLYTPTTTSTNTKISMMRPVPATTTCQTFTIDGGKGTFTTLTISSDIAKTTQSIVPSRANTPVAIPDSTARPRSQIFIPIASTATGISYLMTSSISSLPEVSQTFTTASAIGTHNALVRSDVTNQTRTRFLLPVAQNVPSTVAGLSSTIDTNRSLNNTLAIISPPLDTTGNPIATIRAFAIAKPQTGNAFLSPNTERAARSSSATAIISNSSGGIRDELPSITALLTSDMTSSSSTTSEMAPRPLSRIYMPFIQSSSNSLSSSTTSNITTRGLTPSTYIFTSSMGTLPANAKNAAIRPTQRVVIPLIHTGSVAVTTPTTTTARPLTTDFTSTMYGAEGTSKLRNRLLIPTVTAAVDNDGAGNTTAGTPSITAYTITRNCPTQGVSTTSGLSRSSEIFNPLTSSTPHNMLSTNSSYISFATTTVPSTAQAKSHSSLAPDKPSTPLCLFTTATPTLTSTGHRYVIKLATSQNTGSANVDTTTSAITTPITTTTIFPSEHQFLGPRMAQLRTFPSPRTYSVAQRNVTRPERMINPRAAVTKRIVTAPAPLQIFADVVCPSTTSNQVVSTPNRPGPRFTLSQSSGSSTLIVPHYKNTVFKNLSTIAYPVASARVPSTQPSTERVYLRRSVTCVAPRRTFPITTSASTHSQPQRSRLTYTTTTTSASASQPSNILPIIKASKQTFERSDDNA